MWRRGLVRDIDELWQRLLHAWQGLEESPIDDVVLQSVWLLILETSSLTCATKSRTGRGGGKRVRTIFTQEQLDRLEKEFERQQYMVGTERSVYLQCSVLPNLYDLCTLFTVAVRESLSPSIVRLRSCNEHKAASPPHVDRSVVFAEYQIIVNVHWIPTFELPSSCHKMLGLLIYLFYCSCYCCCSLEPAELTEIYFRILGLGSVALAVVLALAYWPWPWPWHLWSC